MTDNAVKFRSIFYSSVLMGIGLYWLNPNTPQCMNYLTILLMLLSMGVFALVVAEYVNVLQDTENELISAFETHSEIYDVEADYNVKSSLRLFFNLDNEPDNLVINDNICAKLNGRIYSLSDIDAYCNNGERFSGLVLTAPVDISSKHIIAGGTQNGMPCVNIKNFVYSETKDSLAIFNKKGTDNVAVPDDILKIIKNLQLDLEPESIVCSIQFGVMQIAIKTNKSYKDSAQAIYAAMCNLSLRNIDKGAINERVETSQKIRQIKKLK